MRLITVVGLLFFGSTLVLFCLNLFLSLIDTKKPTNNLTWTLDATKYTPEYIYWEPPVCEQKPRECDYPEENFLPYNVEFYGDNNNCRYTTRILFLGDSFTDAPWVNDYESFASEFSRRYAQKNDVCVHTLRLSTGGTGTDQQYKKLIDNVVQLSPDIVIWQFFANDFFENITLALYTVKNKQLVPLPTYKNSIYIAGALNQRLPIVRDAPLMKFLTSTLQTKDVFGFWPVTFKDQKEVISYNKEKISILLERATQLGEEKGFTLFTTIAPLECVWVPNRECPAPYNEYDLALRSLLENHPKFLSVGSPKNDFSSHVLGSSTMDSEYPEKYFNSTDDKGEPGTKHLSKEGNTMFGNLLFNSFLHYFHLSDFQEAYDNSK